MDDGRVRRRVRLAAVAVAVVCLGLLGSSLVAGAPPAAPSVEDPRAVPAGKDADSPRGLTVVTTQGFYTGTHPGARDVADLLVYDADGRLVYQNSTYDVYFDVDPVPGTSATVEYVAARRLGGVQCEVDPCSLNLVERLNLTMGEVTRVYDAVTPEYDTGRWHDVDRLNATHLVVADIVFDRVFVVDVRSGEIGWQWNASDHFPATAGGGAADWTHLNDVEVLDDGRIMVSLRNLDSVVFLAPSGNLQAAWTLGADDDHDTLFEQHNPDFLPAEHGGPALVVADSENNRVVEYRRENGGWALAWAWQDRSLQWPRDADRLPNGHTLVADSHGNRVVELDRNGTAVWSVEVGRPYDVERLGTGDESARGPAASSAGGPPATVQGPGGGSVVLALKRALPGPLVNGLLFVAPPWVGFTDLLVAAVLVLDIGLWGAAEWHWSGRSVRGRMRRLRSWLS